MFLKYLEKRASVLNEMLSVLREKYPNVKFKLREIDIKGPLSETDAGFFAYFYGNDGNGYQCYYAMEHPNNFSSGNEGKCSVFQLNNAYEYK